MTRRHPPAGYRYVKDTLFNGLYNPYADYASYREVIVKRAPKGLSALRADSFRSCRSFEAASTRVFCSLNSLLGVAHTDLLDSIEHDDDELMRLLTGFRQGFWLGLWGLDKVTAVFDEKEAAQFAGQESDWWRDWRTEWLTDRFLPWCVYLSEPGAPKDTLGYFVTFELSEGILTLGCQELREANNFDPFLQHEYVWTEGLTLGEVADGYAFSNSVAEDLFRVYADRHGVEAKEAEGELTDRGRQVARRVFPLLAAFLSEEFPKESYLADAVTNIYIAGDVELRHRKTTDLTPQAVREAVEGCEGAIFDVCQPKMTGRAN